MVARDMATAIYGGETGVTALLAKTAEAEKSAEPVYIDSTSTNKDALMYQVTYYTEIDRSLIAQYENKFNAASWDKWLNYDAQLSATKQDKPVMVASEAIALPAGAHQYLDLAFLALGPSVGLPHNGTQPCLRFSIAPFQVPLLVLE